jgi:hypothetical protein
MSHTAPRPGQRRRHPLGCRRTVVRAAAALLLAVTASPLHAQIVRGRVLASPTERGLDGVTLTLIDETGTIGARTTSAADGRFRFRVDAAGRYTLRVERAGYSGFIAEAVAVGAGEEIALELRMAEDEIVVSPIAVLGRRRTGSAEDFARRVRFMRLAGIGYTLVRGDIAQRHALEITDLLATVPDVVLDGPPRARRVLFTTADPATTCAPIIFVDARLLDAPSVDMVGTPEIVDAIELYNGPAESPAEFDDPAGCGVVLVWTRPDPTDARPVKWRRAVVYIGMTAIGVVLFSR